MQYEITTKSEFFHNKWRMKNYINVLLKKKKKSRAVPNNIQVFVFLENIIKMK